MTNSMRSCDRPRGERRSRKVDPLSPSPMQYAADPGHAARLGTRLTGDLASGGLGADLSGSILEASVDCIKVLDLDGTLHSMNEKGRLVMEIDDFGEVRGLPWIDFWSLDQQPAVAEALAAARSGSIGRFAGYRPTAKGTPKWWDVIISPVRDATGATTHLVAISRDMTENRQRIEAGNLLNLELGHRVRNLFALVNGLITLAARTEPAAKSFAETLHDRFTSLSRALEYIIPSPKDAGVSPEHTLKGLLRTLLTPYEKADRDTPRFVIEGDDTPVGSHATTSLALSIHELATNAVKYGALVEPAGSVTVTIRCQRGECEITWTERGGPPLSAPPTRSGFGSQLLQRSITGPLGGHLTWDWPREGLSLRLVTPLALLGR